MKAGHFLFHVTLPSTKELILQSKKHGRNRGGCYSKAGFKTGQYSASTHLRIISLVMELQWTSPSLLAHRRSAPDVSGQFQRLPKSLHKCSVVNSEVKWFAHLTIIFKVLSCECSTTCGWSSHITETGGSHCAEMK